jgi:hypothetical protein
MRSVPKTWRAREVALVQPRPAQRAPGTRLARAMSDRAARFDLEAGGRFDRRGATVLVWSGPFDAAGDRAEPVGCFYVRWHDPAEDQATIWRLEWDPAQGGSGEEVRRALAILADRRPEPPAPRHPQSLSWPRPRGGDPAQTEGARSEGEARAARRRPKDRPTRRRSPGLDEREWR